MMTSGAEQPPIVPTNLTSLPSEAREQFPPADVLDVGRVPGHKEDMAVVGCCNLSLVQYLRANLSTHFCQTFSLMR